MFSRRALSVIAVIEVLEQVLVLATFTNWQSAEHVTSVGWPGKSHYPSTGGSLHVSELNTGVLRGHYQATDSDHTLYFQSTCDGQVKVWKSDGSTVISNGPVISRPGFRYTTLNDTTFLYDSRGSKIGTDQWEELLVEFQHFRGVILPAHAEAVTKAIDKQLSDPDTHLLSRISHALGKMGIVGYIANCSLPLHMVALSAHKYRLSYLNVEESKQHHQLQYSELGLTRPAGHRRRRSCEEYPNSDDQCLGMCGYGCSCWKWVCDDCCFHQGCYEHDICCRSGSSRCFFIHNLKCSGFEGSSNC